MKYLIILGDGMADVPIESLGNKTILQAANKPNIDKLAALGCNGLLDTIPEGFAPGSEVANMSLLGYDIPAVYEGRGSLEAASMGVSVEPDEMAMRCNFICIEDRKIKSYSAGHISDKESAELISFLQKELGNDKVNFFPGVSYRNLLKIKGGDKRLKCIPPHDIMGTPFAEAMIQAETEDSKSTADLLNDLILRSQTLLENHPVNLKRAAAGKDKANSIWPWSPGYKPEMKTLSDIYNFKSGAVISAADLIKGIGVYAGLQVIEVEGATGLYTTNYESKAQAAIQALRENDFVYLHIEASDEAGHEGDVGLKIKTVEYLDYRIVKPIFDEVSTWDEPVAIALLPDHSTPCIYRTHTNSPVPFIIYKPGEIADEVTVYDECAAEKGSYGLLKGVEFMENFIT